MFGFRLSLDASFWPRDASHCNTGVNILRFQHQDQKIRICTVVHGPNGVHFTKTNKNKYLRPIGDPNATMLMGNTRI
jgi:hypothetical protein